MKNDIRAGSTPAGLMIQAAGAYGEGVMRNLAVGNSLFDKFATYMKEQRNQKREDKQDAQKAEHHSLQMEALSKQNALLQKNLTHYDSDKALEAGRIRAQNAAAYASAGVNNEQSKALKMQRKEREDFEKLAKRLAPLTPTISSGFESRTLDESTINEALKFSEENLNPSRF